MRPGSRVAREEFDGQEPPGPPPGLAPEPVEALDGGPVPLSASGAAAAMAGGGGPAMMASVMSTGVTSVGQQQGSGAGGQAETALAGTGSGGGWTQAFMSALAAVRGT